MTIIKYKNHSMYLPVSLFVCICIKLYEYCRKSPLSLFLLSYGISALNHLNQRKTTAILDSKTRKKQEIIPNQLFNTNKNDKHRFINTIASFKRFKLINRLLTEMRIRYMNSIQNQMSVTKCVFDTWRYRIKTLINQIHSNIHSAYLCKCTRY